MRSGRKDTTYLSFGKDFCLIRFKICNAVLCQSRKNKGTLSQNVTPKVIKNALVQYNEIFENNQLFIDKIDKLLNCLRVGWCHIEEEVEKFFYQNIMVWFSLEVLLEKLTIYEQTFICFFSAQSQEERVIMTSWTWKRWSEQSYLLSKSIFLFAQWSWLPCFTNLN